jgi:hypothetical protein
MYNKMILRRMNGAQRCSYIPNVPTLPDKFSTGITLLHINSNLTITILSSLRLHEYLSNFRTRSCLILANIIVL